MTDTPRPSNQTAEGRLALELFKQGPIHHLPVNVEGNPAWLGVVMLLTAFTVGVAVGVLVSWLI